MVARLVRSLKDTARFLFDGGESIASGAAYEAIQAMIRECQAALLVVTPDFLSSSWTNFEAGLLVQFVWERPDFRVIPVLLRGVRSFDLPPPLSRWSAIEGSTLSDQELIEALKAAIEAVPTPDAG
jgi:hypothetical protein